MDREREMYEQRVTEGLTLRELAQRYGVGPERVRQLLYRYASQTTNQPVNGRAMSRAATAARRAKDLAQRRLDCAAAAWRRSSAARRPLPTMPRAPIHERWREEAR
jgi:transposase